MIILIFNLIFFEYGWNDKIMVSFRIPYRYLISSKDENKSVYM